MILDENLCYEQLTQGKKNLAVLNMQKYCDISEYVISLLEVLVRYHGNEGRAVKEKCENYLRSINALVQHKSNLKDNYARAWRDGKHIAKCGTKDFIQEMGKYVEGLRRNRHLGESTLQSCRIWIAEIEA